MYYITLRWVKPVARKTNKVPAKEQEPTGSVFNHAKVIQATEFRKSGGVSAYSSWHLNRKHARQLFTSRCCVMVL